MGLLAKGDDRHILVETFMACRFGQAALEVSWTIDLDFGLFNCLRCMPASTHGPPIPHPAAATTLTSIRSGRPR